MTPFICAYLLLLNLVAFALMGIDKRRARREEWRVPERSFFLLAFFGGSLGAIAGMFAFRHKTKHRSFRVGLPAILFLQLALLGFLLYQKLVAPWY